MNIKSATSKSIIALIVMIFSMALNRESYCQTFRINHNGKTGHAFTTEVGTITALHVGGIAFDHYYPALDIAIDTRSKSLGGYKISNSPPAYFIDRRGTRHTLKPTGNYHLQTMVSLRFFPGESGMPVFASDGTVCCVVLGNAFTNGRWRGRVAPIAPLTSRINMTPTQ